MVSTVLTRYFKKNPNRIFLLDGCGAIVSATCLGIILPFFKDLFGMPIHILHILALIALVFAIYSFTCYFFSFQNWKPYLKIIMTANAFYCILTAGLVVYCFPVLTFLGMTYFVLEIIVICAVIWLESKVIAKRSASFS